MNGRAAIWIVVVLAASAAALAVLQQWLADEPETSESMARCRSVAASLGAVERPAPPVTPPLVAERTVEKQLDDPLCVARRFFGALLDDDVDAAAELYRDAVWNRDSSREYLRSFHDVVVRKCLSKVRQESIQYELEECGSERRRFVDLESGARWIARLHLCQDQGSWSVERIE